MADLSEDRSGPGEEGWLKRKFWARHPFKADHEITKTRGRVHELLDPDSWREATDGERERFRSEWPRIGARLDCYAFGRLEG